METSVSTVWRYSYNGSDDANVQSEWGYSQTFSNEGEIAEPSALGIYLVLSKFLLLPSIVDSWFILGF